MTIVVVDYGMGNVGSVANMLRKLGRESTVSDDPAQILAAERLVLPGVGAFDVAMANLAQRGLIEALDEQVLARGTPVLGICLGMQLLADASEEGPGAGLGWVPGQVRRMPGAGPDGPLRIPHMGWNRLRAERVHPVVSELADDARFYFVHSYALDPDDPGDSLATTIYGSPFVSAVARANIVGVQFHPEKSHRHGKALLAAWLES